MIPGKSRFPEKYFEIKLDFVNGMIVFADYPECKGLVWSSRSSQQYYCWDGSKYKPNIFWVFLL